MRCSNCNLEVSSLVPVIRNGEYKPLCIDCFFCNDLNTNVIDIVNELLISDKNEMNSSSLSDNDEGSINVDENSLSEVDDENFQPTSDTSIKLSDMITPQMSEKIKKMEPISRKISEKDRLLLALSEAIRNEQYENAGLLRDKIQRLNEQQIKRSENRSTES
ncbi:MAG: UvrB/UvrC motif-containing protein [Chitinispirillaceae bacterium]|nr:UvrB/UvrC motif-containing protein [Chitinispirillaceae bacterium]